MRKIILLAPAVIWLAAQLAACGSSQQTSSSTANTTTTTTQTTGIGGPPTQPAGNAAPVTSAHGGPAASTAPAGSQAAPLGVDTAALDAKIKETEAKAKAAGASDADKRAAANAYLERANVYYNAGQPSLYKFALGDFRRALKYQPDNAEAKAKMQQIIDIYNSLGRPVPDNGLEP